MERQQSFFNLAWEIEERSKLEVDPDEAFERFWAAYPKKRAKKDARKAWGRLTLTRALVADIMSGLTRYKLSVDWLKDGGQYIPLPATFIRGERWQDEIEVKYSPPPIKARTKRCHKCQKADVALKHINGKVWCIDCYQKYG